MVRRMYLVLKELEDSLNYISLLRSKLINGFNDRFEQDNKDTLRIINYSESLLASLHNTIHTIEYIYEMIIILERSARILNRLKHDMIDLIPDIESKLDKISESLIEARAVLRINNKQYQELPSMVNDEELPSMYRIILE